LGNKKDLIIPYTLLNKSFYAIIIFTCLFIIECSKQLINNMLNSIPTISTFDLAIKYMQTDRHDLALGAFSISLVMIIMIFLIRSLIKNFLDEDITGKILSLILIATSIFVIMFAIWRSSTTLQILGVIMFIDFMLMNMFSRFNLKQK